MSSIYTPSKASFTVQVTLPSDGDPPVAAAWNTPLETNADNAAYLNDKAFYGVEGHIHVPLGVPVANAGPDYITFDDTLWAWVQTDVTDAGGIVWPVKIGIKGRITEVLAEIDGDAGPGGAHGAMPATTPTIQLVRIEYSAAGSEVTAIGLTSDPAAGLAAYEAPHTFGPTGLTEDIDENRSYYVKFTGEDGANKQVDSLLLADIRIKLEATP